MPNPAGWYGRTDAPPTDPNALPATTTVTAQPTGVTSDGTTWTGKADLAHVSAGTYGVALVEGRRGIIEVEPGTSLPGAGRVEEIRRQDGRWVVVTTKGMIVPAR